MPGADDLDAVAGRGRDEALDVGRPSSTGTSSRAVVAHEGLEAGGGGGHEPPRAARARRTEGVRHPARGVDEGARPEHDLLVGRVDGDLALRLVRRMVDAHREWLAEAEREPGAGGATG
jgi:hypothetical protein